MSFIAAGSRRVSVALAALVCAASVSHAQNWKAEADLDGTQVNPPNASPGYGNLELSFIGSGKLTYSLTWADLIGTASASRIQTGGYGANGPTIVVLPLGAGAGTTAGAAGGTVELTPAQAALIDQGEPTSFSRRPSIPPVRFADRSLQFRSRPQAPR